MDISSLSSTAAVASTTSVQRSSSDGQRAGGEEHHHGMRHGGGHSNMMDSIVQALQSAGVTLPDQPPASDDPAPADPGSDAGSGSSPVGKGQIRDDMRNVVHSLFEAVKAENTSGDSSTAQAGTKGAFASGLSALISDVSNGQAPSDLQSAFDKLVSDVQSVSPSSGSTTAQPSLLTALTKLQDNLGYAGNGSTPAVGTLVSSTA